MEAKKFYTLEEIEDKYGFGKALRRICKSIRLLPYQVGT